MDLPKEATIAVDLLQNGGFEAFAVGGYVRDRLLGKECHDIDLTTSATPNEMRRVFSSYQVIDTGIRHGTVTVLIEGTPIEITTFRTEGVYSDSRHPDEIKFTRRLEEDLSRRDFTVNAMAYSQETGLVDLYDGQEDLRNRVLRCVGKAQERFDEDALRVLRLLRFASVLGFSVEKETKQAAFACKERLSLLSKERIAFEIKGILCGEHVRDVLCEYWDILSVVFPFLVKMHSFDQHNFHHCYDLLTHTAVVVSAAPKTPALRLAAFFHDSGKPDCFSIDENDVGHFYGHAAKSAERARASLEDLRFDRKTIENVVLLVKLHDTPIEEDARAIKRKLNQYGSQVLFDLIALQRADTLGLAPAFHDRLEHFDALERLTNEVLETKAVFTLRDLAVNGNDLKKLGFRGKRIGTGLQTLMNAVIDERVANEKAALLRFLEDNT